jgi:hypothetical protein
MIASRLHSTPGTDDMLSAEGIQLDIVVPNSGCADTHTFRMAAASDTQAANVAGTGWIEMVAIATTFSVHAHAPTVPRLACPWQPDAEESPALA